MANKHVARIEIDRDSLMRILQYKGLSLRKLDKDPNFYYTARTISRAFKDGASMHLCKDLSDFLKVPISSFAKPGNSQATLRQGG